MNHISPSRLEATNACPRYAPDDRPNDAAIAGTLVHEILEHLVELDPDTWQDHVESLDVGPDTKGLVEESMEQIRGYLSLGLPVVPNKVIRLEEQKQQPLALGVYPECEVETWPGKRGFIDLLVVPAEGYAVVVDYKTVKVEHDFELQLGAYACALRRLCGPWTQIVGRIVAPRLDEGTVEDMVWDDQNVVALAELIARIEERADNPFTPGTAGPQCTYCKWNGKCPFQARAIKELAPTESGVTELVARVLTDPATPEERANRRNFIGWMEKFIDAAKEQDKAYFNANADAGLPGYKVVRSMGRSSMDKTRMAEVYRKLKGTFALDDQQMLSASQVDKDAFIDMIAFSCNLTKKDATAQYLSAVDEFMKRGAPIVSLRREAVKATKQISNEG